MAELKREHLYTEDSPAPFIRANERSLLNVYVEAEGRVTLAVTDASMQHTAAYFQMSADQWVAIRNFVEARL